MAHDGTNHGGTTAMTNLIQDGLIEACGQATEAAAGLLDKARAAVRQMVVAEGRVSGALLEENQTAAIPSSSTTTT